VTGAGVVGIVVGAVFGGMAKSRFDASNSGSPPPCNAADECDPHGLSLRHDAKAAATASTIAFIAGAGVAAGGLVVYLTAPRRPSTALTIVPAATAGGGVAFLRGFF
jgi:hypothetical protein